MAHLRRSAFVVEEVDSDDALELELGEELELHTRREVVVVEDRHNDEKGLNGVLGEDRALLRQEEVAVEKTPRRRPPGIPLGDGLGAIR